MGVGEDFEKFKANYDVTAAEVVIISSRYRRITRQLNSDLRGVNSDTANSIYVGSYGRGTAASGGVSDIDMAYILPVQLYYDYGARQGNGQSDLLQLVRRSIQNTLPNTNISGNGQVVQVLFTGGAQFEVLPAFNHKDGSSFIYPDSNNGGTWQVTNPRAEIAAIRARNDATNGNLKNLCRMMRVWREFNTVPITGMLIDTLAYQFIGDWEHRSKSFYYHDYMARDFFKFMADQNPKQEWWRAPGTGKAVFTEGDFQAKAKIDYGLSLKAIEHDQNGNAAARRATWRRIFGPRFPEV